MNRIIVSQRDAQPLSYVCDRMRTASPKIVVRGARGTRKRSPVRQRPPTPRVRLTEGRVLEAKAVIH